MLYQVQREIGDNWENWSMGDDGKTPSFYDTLDEAIDAIRDHVKDGIDAVEGGHMEDSEEAADFRIVSGKDIYDHDGRNGSWEYAINYTGAALEQDRLREFAAEIKELLAGIEDLSELSQEECNSITEESQVVDTLSDILDLAPPFHFPLVSYIEVKLNNAFEFYIDLKKQIQA